MTLPVPHQEIEVVRQYVANQLEHHKKIPFQDEYRKLLEEHGIKPDEKHMWE